MNACKIRQGEGMGKKSETCYVQFARMNAIILYSKRTNKSKTNKYLRF